jgi:hypothetical protein
MSKNNFKTISLKLQISKQKHLILHVKKYKNLKNKLLIGISIRRTSKISMKIKKKK